MTTSAESIVDAIRQQFLSLENNGTVCLTRDEWDEIESLIRSVNVATTISRVRMREPASEINRGLLRQTSREAVERGGSFSIVEEFINNQWYCIWTITCPGKSGPQG